jgi:8-oxo-dGTP pyrophosphatase MutT (NUDIX family)
VTEPRHAAVCLVIRDGLVLCVWNRRYEGWTLPGGMVEPTDGSPEDAAKRELYEETGMRAGRIEALYEAPADPSMAQPGRASIVHVFRVTVHYLEQPQEREHGCPVGWMTRDEFLSRVPFTLFYRRMFEELDEFLATHWMAE